MNVIDQNSALTSRNRLLVPAPLLIDSRTEQDRLRFLADFASLINFYDNDNKVRGNWAPFLLKDPVFLLANIATTNIAHFLQLYNDSCRHIKQLAISNKPSEETVIRMNHLFDQLTRLFMRLERWTYYMQASDADYPLKKYVFHQVKATFSPLFWAVLGLQNDLSLLLHKYRVDSVKYYLFEKYDHIIWQQNKNNRPFWEILGLENPVMGYNVPAILNALKNAGDQLFDFLTTVIQHAATEFESVKIQKGKFPDTLLLRAFTDMLAVHQEQLNGISAKHLQFYYHDILKQAYQPAIPDKVFICAELAKKDTPFMLNAGTMFDAGINAMKAPITFIAANQTSLNPAAIANAYTVLFTKSNTSKNAYTTEIQKITNPDVIKKNENGTPLSWKTFGGASSGFPVDVENVITSGLAIASPMLLLQGGKRHIFLKLLCNEIDPDILNSATCYLSAGNQWLRVKSNCTENGDFKTIAIRIDPGQPPIAPFKNNPEKLDSTWPVLKIEFKPGAVPVKMQDISKIDIRVIVSQLKTFQLYNDYGGISSKAAFQPFGATPLLNSNFIVGSQEIFSKPVEVLFLRLKWDNLPPKAKQIVPPVDEFTNYYCAYNNYLSAPNTTTTIPKKCLLAKLFSKTASTNDITLPGTVPFTFHNESFKTNFQLLSGSVWSCFDMRREGYADIRKKATTEEESAVHVDVPVRLRDKRLFGVYDGDLTGNTLFSYFKHYKNPIVADPAIQLSPLKFTDTSSSGFIKMSLTGSPYGFGSQLYQNVVSQIAFNNSQTIYEWQCPSAPSYMPPANLPFVPKVTDISAEYMASTEVESYPVQCFLYSPLSTVLIYDGMLKKDTATDTSNTSLPDETINVTPVKQPTVPLTFSSLLPKDSPVVSGALLLEIENLIPADSLSLYFELTRKFAQDTENKSGAAFFYLRNQAWVQLTVIADGTHNFTCSGIVRVSIPTDITPEDFMNETGKFWFCIIPEGDPSTFSEVVFLKTNGIQLQRLQEQNDGQPNQLAGYTISKLRKPIPEISTVIQPFASFGGKSTEDDTRMNQRISTRLQAKDRAITAGDFFRLIKQEFSNVYYTKPVFNSCTNITEVYVIKNCAGIYEPNAFAPLLNACEISAIENYFHKRVSGADQIKVLNFKQVPVHVTANIKVKPGFTNNGVGLEIDNAINLYLSPWIAAEAPQMAINKGLTNDGLAKLISRIAGVAEVRCVIFSPLQIANNELYVSAMNHKMHYDG